MPPVTPKAKWIPTSERLPASDEDVLVTDGTGIYVGQFITDMGWRVDSRNEHFMVIEAWMLPPKPYKEESENKNGTLTNGDMIKVMFPNVEVKEKNNGYEVYFGVGTAVQFFNHQWWNAPYKEESENKNENNNN